MYLRFLILIALGIYVLFAQPMASGNTALGIIAILGGVFWIWLHNRNSK
jgi:hypothetical protein